MSVTRLPTLPLHPLSALAGGSGSAPAIEFSRQPNDGCFLVARALAKLGVKEMFGVIGIPVTQLASGQAAVLALPTECMCATQ